MALFWGHRHIARLLSSSWDGDVRHVLPERETEEPDIYFNREILNRMSEKRTDSEWLAAQRYSPLSVFILFHNLNPLVSPRAEDASEGEPNVRLCKLKAGSVEELLRQSDTVVIFLGAEKQERRVETERDEPVTWFALNTEHDPTKLIKTKDPNTFFLKGPMPGLLLLSDNDAGETHSFND